MNPNDILNIKYSPILVSKILYSFCLGAKRIDERGAKFELVYLVLPFVMDDDFRIKLKSRNIASTFKTTFFQKNEVFKEKMFFINEKVKYSRNVTNDGLIYLSSVCDMTIDEFFSVSGNLPDTNEQIVSEFETDCFKAAYNLGSIFSKEGYINVLLKTKVNNI
ncbi:three component ABC system middle component [Vibrio splendidus]|uniref:three component ABC system middle component n=1 Tax=Vibrio splendidus TaxID=29497 RepID=UPI0000670E11|nr:three component ABC system middle component [Vibrio splendidus]EAP93415.1 hypothetical protein V12B01_23839 [Vibrio splendidus 12B01]